VLLADAIEHCKGGNDPAPGKGWRSRSTDPTNACRCNRRSKSSCTASARNPGQRGQHARASSATVRIAAEDDTVSIEVSDDGRGFDPGTVGTEHFGLRSMRGRVADLGGRLEVRSTPGRGTVLRVEVPAEN
jgi:Histidine kinase-, DNA gyrase B-, and HSP90-like ATPase